VNTVGETTERAESNQGIYRLVAHQFVYDLRCFWRNTQSRFFTLALPVFLLVLFASVFKGQNVAVPGGRINESVYYVPGIIVFGVIAATLSNLTVTIVGSRESGIYKRRRATPVPSGVVIAGRALVGVLVALAITAVMLIIGWAGYGASIPGRTAPAFVFDVVLGAVVFCCLGFALASVINSADAAQPVVQGIILPLSFISGVFIPYHELPHWLVDVGAIFPVRPFASAVLAAYNPHTTGSGFNWGDIAVLAAWGVAGLFIAIRRFSWLPRSG
jgi:ABC-2 type transport system permease protein